MSQLLEVMETWSIGEVADLAPNVIRALFDGGLFTPNPRNIILPFHVWNGAAALTIQNPATCRVKY